MNLLNKKVVTLIKKPNNLIFTYCKLLSFRTFSLQNTNNPIGVNNLYKITSFNFAKGGNNKGEKSKKEKEVINKQYENISTDELKSKYKAKAEEMSSKLKAGLMEIRVQRSNPKILDNISVNVQGKREKITELATIMLRAANILVISPFEEAHKEFIIKGLVTTKLDLQITSEGNNIVVTLGAIPDDLKTENLKIAKKLFDLSKEQIKELRRDCLDEMKKLEKILGKDEARRIEKGMIEVFEKITKQLDQVYKQKEEEIKTC